MSSLAALTELPAICFLATIAAPLPTPGPAALSTEVFPTEVRLTVVLGPLLLLPLVVLTLLALTGETTLPLELSYPGDETSSPFRCSKLICSVRIRLFHPPKSLHHLRNSQSLHLI